MISIRPGYSGALVREYLQDAMLGAKTLVGSFPGGFDGYTRYIDWATTHQRTLGAALEPDELNRLITTRRYWALLSVSMTSAETMTLIKLELSERADELEREHEALRVSLLRWPVGTVMGVLDTNVMLLHHQDLDTFDWHTAMDLRPDVPLTLWVPIVVVGELDRLKRDRQVIEHDGKKVPRRTLARAALKVLNSMFERPDQFPSYKQQAGMMTKNIEFGLLMDDRGHVRLDHADDEIIDRALALSALASRTYLVTYDNAMAFSARHLKLEAVLLKE